MPELKVVQNGWNQKKDGMVLDDDILNSVQSFVKIVSKNSVWIIGDAC